MKKLPKKLSPNRRKFAQTGHPEFRTEVKIRVARFFLVQIYQIGKNITNDHKLYQTAINYTKWPLNIPNGHKIKHLQFKGPPKFTQMGVFGLKTNHLATLDKMCVGKEFFSLEKSLSRY
jgi:hypothetical protein